MSRMEDAFVPVEVVQQHFDDAFDRIDMLSSLIALNERCGSDVAHLRAKLKEAEAERAAMYAALRSAQHRKSIPISALTPCAVHCACWRPNLSLPVSSQSLLHSRARHRLVERVFRG